MVHDRPCHLTRRARPAAPAAGAQLMNVDQRHQRHAPLAGDPGKRRCRPRSSGREQLQSSASGDAPSVTAVSNSDAHASQIRLP